MPTQNGISKRDHYAQVEKQIGHKLAETTNPKRFPRQLAYVWSAFSILSMSRLQGFSGPNPITYQDIKAWCDLTNEVVSARDVEAIKLLDRAYIKVCNE